MSNPRGRQTEETLAAEKRAMDFIRRAYRRGEPTTIAEACDALVIPRNVISRAIARYGLGYMVGDARRKRETWLTEDQINQELDNGPTIGNDGLPTYSDRLMLVINTVIDNDNMLSTKPLLRERVVSAGMELFANREREYRWSSDPRVVALRFELGAMEARYV